MTRNRDQGRTCNSKQIEILQHSFLPRRKQNGQIPVPRTLEKAIEPGIPTHHVEDLEYRFRRRRGSTAWHDVSPREGFVFLFGVDVFVEEVSVYAGYC